MSTEGLYVAENVMYSLWLKHLPIFDCFCIAAGFIFRVYAGSFAIGELVSDWLFLTIVAMSLFMAFGKRRKNLKNGVSFTEKDLLFTTAGCTHLDGKNFLRAWERTLKRADVRYRKFHNVRHTYATKLFEAGVELLTVSKLLGHANIGITAGTYVHVMPAQKNSAAEKLNYLF